LALGTWVNLNHNYIPGLSNTVHFNFQDFPVPTSFSRTFQVLEILEKINQGLSRIFQEAWEPRLSYILITSSYTETIKLETTQQIPPTWRTLAPPNERRKK